ncbi:MAG: DUF547 domain-containing protein [Desulfurellaceae bacterium]|nr:DUF547 domain-containing protein [Desulfurellaceae bacterium]
MRFVQIKKSLARARDRIMLGLLGVALLAGVAKAAPGSELLSTWEASVETNAAAIDHSAWQSILDTYLTSHPSGINRFDYAALKANAEDAARLADYLTSLQELDPRHYSRQEQQAYWINFYNALTVRVVVDAYPVDSIRDIYQGWLPLGPWDDVHAEVAGMPLTLNNIEHGILRPIWRDPRIHYAVNCASHGCPNLSPTVYTAANTEALLEAGARAYINHPRGVSFVDDDFLLISSIYEWYVEDFGGTEKTVIDHLMQYAEEALAARLKTFSGSIDYEYDWNLNTP